METERGEGASRRGTGGTGGSKAIPPNILESQSDPPSCHADWISPSKLEEGWAFQEYTSIAEAAAMLVKIGFNSQSHGNLPASPGNIT